MRQKAFNSAGTPVDKSSYESGRRDAEVEVRQKIVDNISALISRRLTDRRSRRLKLDDPVTEAIKEIGVGIGQRRY
jgi:hypothetical protein